MQSQHKWPIGHFFKLALMAACLLFLCIRAYSLENINKEDLVRVLDENGLRIGSFVWLRYPMYDATDAMKAFPGLTKLKVKDFDVRQKYSFSTYDNHLVMVAEYNGTDHVLEISRYAFLLQPSDIVDKFYLEYPTKKVASWGKKVLKAISEGNTFLGMTQEQVITCLGHPTRINSSVGRWGKREQWVFGDSSPFYLYFDNGRLSSWQN